MAGENDPSNMTKSLTPLFRELDTLSKNLRAASENLSNSGLDKFSAEIKKALKNTGLFNDEVLDNIKTYKELTSTLEDVEAQYNAIKKHEAKARAIAEQQFEKDKRLFKSKVEQEKQIQISTDTIKESLIANDKNLQLTKQQTTAIEKNYKSLLGYVQSTKSAAEAGDRLTKVHEGLTSSVKKQIEGFGTLGTAVSLLKKAVTTSYDQLHRLSSVGMLGAFTAVNTLSLGLRITSQEFEELIQQNRSLVIQMGGGLAGVSKFADELGEAKKSLSFLGKDAAKAGARFMQISQKSGLSPKEGALFRKNYEANIKQFKRFQGIWGDSYEEFAQLTEAMNEESSTKTRLNAMAPAQRFAMQEEIRMRTLNLKAMGLQNNQIIEVNKTMASLVNPEDDDVAKSHKEAIMSEQAYDETIRLLYSTGQAQQAKNMEESRAVFKQITTAVAEGRAEEAQRISQSTEGMKALADFERGIGATNTDNVNRYDRLPRSILMKESGDLLKKLRVGGAAQAEADTQGRGIKQADLQKQILAAEELAKHSGAAAQSLAKMSDAVNVVNNLLNNPFALAIGGFLAGLWAITKLFKVFGGVARGAGKAIGIAGSGASIMTKAFGLIKTVAAGFVTALAAMGLDKLFGLAGIGKGEIKEEQDDKNWDRMEWDEKVESGIARGVEKTASFIGLTNVSNQARMTRIEKETEYLKSKGRAPAPTTLPASANLPTTSGMGMATPVSVTGSQSSSAPSGPRVIPNVPSAQGNATSSSIPQSQGGMLKPPTVSGGAASSGGAGVTTKSPSGGQNLIAKVVQTGPGWLIVNRPDGTTEKLTGARNWRNNNPGNIEAGKFADSLGAIGSDGRFAIFPDYDTGRRAKEHLIFAGKNYKDLSLTAAINRYAPPVENDTSMYQAQVLAVVGGVNKPMNEYTPEERQKILDAMQKVEGYKVGKTVSMSSGSVPTTAQPQVANASAKPQMSSTFAGAPGSSSFAATVPSTIGPLNAEKKLDTPKLETTVATNKTVSPTITPPFTGQQSNKPFISGPILPPTTTSTSGIVGPELETTVATNKESKVSQPQISSNAQTTMSSIDELKKQTSLLTQLVRNTESRVGARGDSYQADQGMVMGATS